VATALFNVVLVFPISSFSLKLRLWDKQDVAHVEVVGNQCERRLGAEDASTASTVFEGLSAFEGVFRNDGVFSSSGDAMLASWKLEDSRWLDLFGTSNSLLVFLFAVLNVHFRTNIRQCCILRNFF
jgi:hypothetical protein